MAVRPYETRDRASVAAMDVDTEVRSVADLRLAAGRFTWSESPLSAPRRKHHDLATYLDEDPSPWHDAFVATTDGRVTGFAAAGLSAWNRRLVLWHMYVDSPARGQGVGTSLLQAVLASGSAASAQHVWLETQTDNVPAIRAYQRMGFRVVGLDQTLYGDAPGADTAVYLSRPI
jgi:ribosomal protein S18 acetylase RimI-like enzyme